MSLLEFRVITKRPIYFKFMGRNALCSLPNDVCIGPAKKNFTAILEIFVKLEKLIDSGVSLKYTNETLFFETLLYV